MNQRFLLIFVSVLTGLTVLSVLAANLFDIGSATFQKWGLGAVLAEIVVLFGLMVRTSLKGQPININLSLPEEWHAEFGNLQWDAARCFIKAGDKQENITLAESDIGPAFTVQLSVAFVSGLTENQLVHFDLADTQGRNWRVGPFRLYERTRKLICEVEPEAEPLYD